MDLTPLEHAAATAVSQIAIGVLTGNWWVGGLLGICWFVAREHTQAEYRWIEHRGEGLRANMPWWGGFDPRVWNLASIFDFLAPIIAAVLIYLSVTL